MTVKVRPYKRGGWEVDITLTIPGRPKVRERRKAPVTSKSAAKRWGEERERQLIQHAMNTDPTEDGSARPGLAKKEVPTLAQFIPRYTKEYAEANQLKPATLDGQRKAFENHIIPALGRKRLDRITAGDIQRFKGDRSHLKPTSVNLMLKFIRGVLNVAVEWKVIDVVPVKFKMLKEPKATPPFYDFEEFDRLVLAAEKMNDPNRLLLALLGGEAGLRCGEIRGLQWSDIDLDRGLLTVSRAVWRNHVGPPKGGRPRTIPLAPRLHAALREHRHLRDPHVLLNRRGNRADHNTIRLWLTTTQTAAGFAHRGPHLLRHTFCSHLAMRGRGVRVIQELAGHESIRTTERYMHLAPAAARDAVESLRRPSDWRHLGDGDPKAA